MTRRARPSDAPAIARLLDDLGYPAEPAAVRERLLRLGRGDAVLLAGDADGFVAVHRIPRVAEGGAFARITALVVAADQRGRGLGRELLAAAEEAARGWGCDLVEVSSGRRPERSAAHGLYAAAGYRDAGDLSVRYWKTLISG